MHNKDGFSNFFLINFFQIVVDIKNDVIVLDLETYEKTTHIEGSEDFEITAIVHPSTYINKVFS